MAAESTEAMAVPADEAGMVVDGDAAAADGDAISSDFGGRALLNHLRQQCRHRILMNIHFLDLQ